MAYGELKSQTLDPNTLRAQYL